VVGCVVLLAHIGLVLGGCNNIGLAIHLDTSYKVPRTASEAIQTEWLWRHKLEQGHSMGNSHLLAFTDSEAVPVGQDLQAEDERI